MVCQAAEKVKTLQGCGFPVREPRDGYKILMVCHKKYSGPDKVYNFIEAGVYCKTDKMCDQPTMYCSGERNYH
jgi:hypothetical protein